MYYTDVVGFNKQERARRLRYEDGLGVSGGHFRRGLLFAKTNRLPGNEACLGCEAKENEHAGNDVTGVRWCIEENEGRLGETDGWRILGNVGLAGVVFARGTRPRGAGFASSFLLVRGAICPSRSTTLVPASCCVQSLSCPFLFLQRPQRVFHRLPTVYLTNYSGSSKWASSPRLPGSTMTAAACEDGKAKVESRKERKAEYKKNARARCAWKRNQTMFLHSDGLRGPCLVKSSAPNTPLHF